MADKGELPGGWATGFSEPGHGPGWTEYVVRETYHFQHVPPSEVARLERRANEDWVVVTVVPVKAEDGSLHKDTYYFGSLLLALAKAATVAMFGQECAEYVVDIRPATAKEREAFRRLCDGEEG